MGEKPFMLKPAAKDYLWGGQRLNEEFEKNIDMTPLAETWECSTHPDGPSTVVSGKYKGQSLIDVIKNYPGFLGEHPIAVQKSNGNPPDLPILIKFIDAKKDLSVQVHPSDEYAKQNENGQLGKTEMWYVLDATKDASLVYGLQFPVNEEKMRKSIQLGTLEKYLQKVEVKKDDVFFIEAGTIHAIGAGALIAEIQENSNLTYRLYDYDRVDTYGNKRLLHVDKALAVSNMESSSKPKQPMRVLKYKKGCAYELLNRCRYFEVYRMLLNTERCKEMVDYYADSDSFRVLLCINGCGIIILSDNENIPFFKGDCIFFPANSEVVKLHGKAQFLDIRG